MSRSAKRRKRLGLNSPAARAFSRETLATLCVMPESAFASAYAMERHAVPQPAPADFFLFRDNGSNILAVAHLDTVARADTRGAHFVDTEGGPVVFSRALDDRLGAYVILELLPKLGVKFDWLLTTGEETGQSTAEYFTTEKDYNWIIEFDRGGTDVVMYQYEDSLTRELVRECGARVGDGILSDISYLEHLGVKAFNWGVGYREYHYARSHAFLSDTFDMVTQFVRFYNANADLPLEHETAPRVPWWHYAGTGASSDRHWWDEIDAGEGDIPPLGTGWPD